MGLVQVFGVKMLSHIQVSSESLDDYGFVRGFQFPVMYKAVKWELHRYIDLISIVVLVEKFSCTVHICTSPMHSNSLNP